MSGTFPAQPRWIAAFCHGPEWDSDSKTISIADGIELSPARACPAWAAYERLCVEKGVHDGEPFAYGAAFIFTPAYSEHVGDFGDPFDTTSVLCTLMVIGTGVPLGILSSFVSFDHFQTIAWHQDLHNYGGHNEFFMTRPVRLDDAALHHIAEAWTHLIATRTHEERSPRVWMALIHCFYAWTSRYSDQRILNLAIALEVLFAPHHQSETTHQIAFNVARYLGVTFDERAELYRRVKRLYGVRSKIVHGASVSDEALISAAAELLGLCAALLQLVLSDPMRIQQFEVESLRKELLDRYLFS